MTVYTVTTMEHKTATGYNPDNFTVNGMRLAGLEVTADGYTAKVIGGCDGRREHLRQLQYVAVTGDEAAAILELAEQYRFISEDEAMPGLHVYDFCTEQVADWLAGQLDGEVWWQMLDEIFEDEPYTAADYGLGPVL